MQINVIIDSEKINYSSTTVYLVLLLDSLNLSFYSGDSYLSSPLLWNDFTKIYLYYSIFFSIFDWFLKQKSPKQNQEWIYFTIMLAQCTMIFLLWLKSFSKDLCATDRFFFTRANSSAALAFRTQSPSTCQRHHSDWLPWQMCRYNR